MTEYCQISCSLVNYSLGPLILCWESCTHLALCVALKVNVAVDTPYTCKPFSCTWLWDTDVSQWQLICTWSLSLPSWPFQQAGSVSSSVSVYILLPVLILQPEGDDYCLTISPVKLSSMSLPGSVSAAEKNRAYIAWVLQVRSILDRQQHSLWVNPVITSQ